MSSVSLPVTRPGGTTLIVASPSARPAVLAMVETMQFDVIHADNPYAATILLCRSNLAIGSVILSLSSCYREELAFIETIKRRFRSIEVWLTQTDGRQGALVEAMRRGADGLLSDDGLHRIGVSVAGAAEAPAPSPMSLAKHSEHIEHGPAMMEQFSDHDLAMGEPVLSADELRALLAEQPANPPVHET